MSNYFQYRGFKGIVEYSYEDKCLFGKVIDIDDVVLFEVSNPEKAYEIFRKTVDEYLSVKETIKTNIKADIKAVTMHCYVVAEACGWVPEDPDFHYENPQQIIAENEQTACSLYNERNNCNYYYGSVITQLW